MRSARRFALLAAAAGFALAIPTAPAEATPAACTDNCAITATFYGYVAPVVEIADGASVAWSSVDTSHPTLDDQLTSTEAPCFEVPVAVGLPSTPVTFDLADGGLTATTNGNTKACAGAIALGDAGVVLPYKCLVHTNMRAALLVTPTA